MRWLFVLVLIASSLAASGSPNLMLYYSKKCYYSRKVLNYLDQIEKTVPMKDVSKDPQAKQELFLRGGQKFVPCLMVDNTPIYDSDAIIEWLKEHQNILLPKKKRSDILTSHAAPFKQS